MFGPRIGAASLKVPLVMGNFERYFHKSYPLLPYITLDTICKVAFYSRHNLNNLFIVTLVAGTVTES